MIDSMTADVQHQPNSDGHSIRVVMLTFLFPPAFAGGTKQALELSKGLRLKNVQSLFFGARFKNAKPYEVYEGSPVHRLDTADSPRLKYFVYALNACRKLFALRSQVDVIFLHSVRPFSILIILMAKLLRKPVLVTLTLIGNDDPQSLNRKSFLWRLETRSLQLADRVVCKSRAIKDICLEQGLIERQLISIPNGVDVELFKPVANAQEKSAMRKTLGLADAAFIVSFVGRVGFRKGSDILFDAWEAIHEKYPQLTLLLLGPYGEAADTPEEVDFEGKLRGILERAGEMNIKFLGKMPHTQIAEYLRLSDCFVFPSRFEGLPNAVIEAMASGLPVACMRIAGITDDIIDSGIDGIIVDEYEARALAAAIEEIMNDKVLAEHLAANAVKKIREKFSIDSVATRHRELYKTLLDNRS